MFRRPFALLFSLLALTNLAPRLCAQVLRDPQALAIATQAYKVLGGTLPADSRAIGTYSRVAGSTEDSGTIEVLIRGWNQTSTKITNSDGTTEVVYSRGYAVQKDTSGVIQFSLEKSVSSMSAISPLTIIAAAVLDTSSTVQFVATESVNGTAAYHIRVCLGSPDQNFTANINTLGTKDIWLATDSELPLEISYQTRDSFGNVPIPVTYLFSQYKSVNSVLYPFQIQKSFNGTPYMTVSMTSVASGVGLTDQNFSLQ